MENWDDNENEMDWEQEDEGEEWEHNDEDTMHEVINAENLKKINKPSYETLKLSDIRKEMDGKISEVSDMLGVSDWESELLLVYFKWNKQRLTERYFSEERDQIRVSSGVEPKKKTSHSRKSNNRKKLRQKVFECPICLDDFKTQADYTSLTCGHNICTSCWHDYLTIKGKNKDCAFLTCPFDGCTVACCQGNLKNLGLDTNRIIKFVQRQKRFQLEVYISECKELQGCLGADCQFVQQFTSESLNKLTDVQCKKCDHVYCIKCKQKGHRPCPCAIADQWWMKATSEAENMQWILAKTKKCPKCHVPIEKNQGCNHMTCKHCKHEFCWLCKGDWNKHGSATGGYYKCNIYEENKQKGVVSMEEQASRNAKTELERFSFHFTRFDNHIKAIEQMKKTYATAESKMAELMTKYQWKPNEVSFLQEVATTVIECRRLLAWSYPIGYYMAKTFKLRELFTQHQKDLEMHVEHLHELSEQKLETFRDNDKRAEVINYQRVTAKYRTNLCKGMEEEINPLCFPNCFKKR